MFYGEKVQQLREMLSYTREDLAAFLQVNEQTIWAIETNQIAPDFRTVNDLKQLFNVQSTYFFEEVYVNAVSDTGQITFRENITNERKGVQSERIYMNYFFTHIRDIEQIVYPTMGSVIPFTQLIENKFYLPNLTNEDIIQIAEEARTELGILSNDRLMYYLEVSGIYIVERELEETVDAYSTWLLEDGYPVIVLNAGKNSAARRNFDMGHELGHLLLHRYVDFDQLSADKMKKIENEANLFSSAFLLSEADLRKDFSKIKDRTNYEQYLPLKEKYKMSIQAIAYRANKAGWMTKEENRRFWKKLNQAGYRKFEPLDDQLTIHIPGKIRALIQHATKQNPNFLSEWVDMYSVDIEYFEYIFHVKDDLLRKLMIKKANIQKGHRVLDMLNG